MCCVEDWIEFEAIGADLPLLFLLVHRWTAHAAYGVLPPRASTHRTSQLDGLSLVLEQGIPDQ